MTNQKCEDAFGQDIPVRLRSLPSVW